MLNLRDNNIVKTRTGVMQWDDESQILFVDVDEGARETLEDAKKNSKIGAVITQNSNFAMLLDITKIGNIDADARHFYSANTSTKNQGIALITNSVISQVLGNLFIGVNKPQMPIKLFSDKTKATHWLKQILSSKQNEFSPVSSAN
jgi:hypothetical protein